MKNHNGLTYGRLIVVNDIPKRNGIRHVLCKCSCGNKKEVSIPKLVRGTTKSCGCLRREKSAEKCRTHGKSKGKLYAVHVAMMNRCYNKNNQSFKTYGARGINVCIEWHDRLAFIHWAETNGWEEGLTIERVDNDDNYCPNNCTFIPLEDQANNRSSSVKITYRGETLTVAAWAKKTGIKYGTIYHRLKAGWPISRIFDKQLHVGGYHYHQQKG